MTVRELANHESNSLQNGDQTNMFKYIVLLTSLTIAGVAAFFSVTGLAKLFAGSFLPVLVMASALEIGKLVTASLLTRSWDNLTKPLKVYYSIATITLIVITSAGIYGFLTAAYQTTADELRLLDRQTTILESRKERYQEQLGQSDGQLEAINTTISQLTDGLANNQIQYVDPETGQLVTSTSRATREALQAQLDVANTERAGINTRRQEWNDSITSLDQQVIELQSNSEVAAEVGPLRYLSNLTGLEMDRVVNYFALMIIFVFDPLAVTLVIAFNRLHMEGRKPTDEDDDDGDDGGDNPPPGGFPGPEYVPTPGTQYITISTGSTGTVSLGNGDNVTGSYWTDLSNIDPENISYTGSPPTEHSVWSDVEEPDQFWDEWEAMHTPEEEETVEEVVEDFLEVDPPRLDKEGSDVLNSKKEIQTPAPDHWSALSRNRPAQN